MGADCVWQVRENAANYCSSMRVAGTHVELTQLGWRALAAHYVA